MKILKYLLLFTFSLVSYFLSAQTQLAGKVSDTEGVSLAFVAVIPNDDVSKAVITDIEGRFSITLKMPIQSLTFRCVGMQTLRLDVDFLNENKDKTLDIVLKYANNAISEVIIRAGENPADRIIRQVVANRDKNNPEKLATFQCKTYNKMLLDIVPNDSAFNKFIQNKDTSEKRVKQAIKEHYGAEKVMSNQHLFMMETVTERRFRYPNDNFERVLLNRVSGFPNAGLVALANMIQPFSFYGDFLRILDKHYVNPISKGSPALYFFTIEDTLYQGIDTVFLISFHPRKGKIFEGMEGVLHINSNQWALQNVRAKPSNKSLSNLKLEQQYHFNDSSKQWFPEQLNFELAFVKYPNPLVGMRIVGRSYISDVTINPILKQKDFNPENPIIIEDAAFGQSDSTWLLYRETAPLSKKELRTYRKLDSLAEKNNFAFWGRLIEVMASGKLPLKHGISLDLSRVLKFNNYENMRVGIGLTTAESRPLRRPKFWETGAYGGYGLRDKALKYGGYMKLRLAQGSQTAIQMSYAQDLVEPGASSGFGKSGLASRSLYANLFDKNEELVLAVGSRLGKRIFMQTAVKKQHMTPLYAYRFRANETVLPVHDFNFSEASVYLKYEFNEQNPTFLGENLNEINRIPVVELNFTHGFDNLLRGLYKFDKWTFAIHQSIMIRRLGKTSWRIEGGKVSGSVPFAKLFTLNQNQGAGSLFVVSNTFQTLGDTVWLSDKFINGYFKQEFGNILYRRKYSQPQLSLVQNIAIGQLSKPEAHLDIPFFITKKPLLESGIMLDNLLKINYMNFSTVGIGVATYYRWGYHTSADWRQNVSVRLSMKMAL